MIKHCRYFFIWLVITLVVGIGATNATEKTTIVASGILLAVCAGITLTFAILVIIGVRKEQ